MYSIACVNPEHISQNSNVAPSHAAHARSRLFLRPCARKENDWQITLSNSVERRSDDCSRKLRRVSRAAIPSAQYFLMLDLRASIRKTECLHANDAIVDCRKRSGGFAFNLISFFARSFATNHRENALSRSTQAQEDFVTPRHDIYHNINIATASNSLCPPVLDMEESRPRSG
jgi:hypothetical protein